MTRRNPCDTIYFNMKINILSVFKPKIAQNHIKVLVIDDAEVDRHMTCAAVEQGGYTSLNAVDGKSGFEMAREQKPALIILDYNLPDVNGPDLCRSLKAQEDTREIPVLYLTGKTDPKSIINCYEQGENYLAKPISAKLLIKQIDSILKNKQPGN